MKDSLFGPTKYRTGGAAKPGKKLLSVWLSENEYRVVAETAADQGLTIANFTRLVLAEHFGTPKIMFP